MDVTFATRPAPRGGPNEDFAAATDRAVVVLDGLSVPEGMDTGCSHGTPWYVQQLGARLLVRMTAVPLVPLADALADAITEVAALHADTCDLSHPGTPAATVALLRTAGWTEYLVLSDASIVLDTAHNGIQVINDNRVNGTAADEERSVLAAQPSTLQRAELRREMISERRAARNKPDGYWVASAQPEAARRAIVGSYRPAHVRQAAVLTDGAARLVDFDLADWSTVFEVLDEKGPVELIARVRDAESSDRECVVWPRSKPYDDATVAYCRIDNIQSRW
jgi:hypothetical protein